METALSFKEKYPDMVEMFGDIDSFTVPILRSLASSAKLPIHGNKEALRERLADWWRKVDSIEAVRVQGDFDAKRKSKANSEVLSTSASTRKRKSTNKDIFDDENELFEKETEEENAPKRGKLSSNNNNELVSRAEIEKVRNEETNEDSEGEDLEKFFEEELVSIPEDFRESFLPENWLVSKMDKKAQKELRENYPEFQEFRIRPPVTPDHVSNEMKKPARIRDKELSNVHWLLNQSMLPLIHLILCVNSKELPQLVEKCIRDCLRFANCTSAAIQKLRKENVLRDIAGQSAVLASRTGPQGATALLNVREELKEVNKLKKILKETKKGNEGYRRSNQNFKGRGNYSFRGKGRQYQQRNYNSNNNNYQGKKPFSNPQTKP